MKKFMLLALMLLLAVPAAAQNTGGLRRQNQPQAPRAVPTPVPANPTQLNAWHDEGAIIPGTGESKFQSTGFLVAPVVKLTQVTGELGWVAGLRAGWFINHKVRQQINALILGVGGYGLFTDVEGPAASPGVTPSVSLKYGGAEVEYVFCPNEILHFSTHFLFGFGQAEYDGKNDSFFVFEPTGNMWVNVTDYFRVGVGIGYRFASGVELSGLDNSDLSGFAGTVTFAFGSF